MSHTLSTTVDQGFADTLDATKARLADADFGVLSEIDLASTVTNETVSQ
jgi:hypothetical protein